MSEWVVPPSLFLRKDVILWGLHGSDAQGCDCKGFASQREFTENTGDAVTPLIRCGYMGAQHPFGYYLRAKQRLYI